jgi:4-diphosphocytidyl-2-C-methyl-D-erythritol kinase
VSEFAWWPAPAKLNLFLRITGRREDGYHELQTIFQLIDCCDRIGVALREDGRIARHSGPAGVEASQDLTVRAALALQRATGARLGADLQVQKRIPMGGGLGGGSSDAATVLLALNQLWGTGLRIGELAGLGLTLGADVPIFVHGRSGWGEGRGEQLWPLPLPQRSFLVLHPGIAVSTAEVFQAPELTRNSPVLRIRAFSEDLSVNDCEAVVCARHPAVAEALAWLRAQPDQHGRALAARMTGTGACVFAPLESGEDAERIAARVPARWSRFVARGLDRSPLHDELESRS